MRARRRGFTLLEVVVVVGIAAIIGAIAVPGMYGQFKRQAVRNEARQLVSSLREARSLAIGRAMVPGLVCGVPPVPCPPRTVGVRITSPTTYEIIGDLDAAAGGEVIIQQINIVRGGDSRVRINDPGIPFDVRFATNGVLAGVNANGRDIAIVDTVTNETHTIRVTAAGFATLDVTN